MGWFHPKKPRPVSVKAPFYDPPPFRPDKRDKFAAGHMIGRRSHIADKADTQSPPTNWENKVLTQSVFYFYLCLYLGDFAMRKWAGFNMQICCQVTNKQRFQGGFKDTNVSKWLMDWAEVETRLYVWNKNFFLFLFFLFPIRDIKCHNHHLFSLFVVNFFKYTEKASSPFRLSVF